MDQLIPSLRNLLEPLAGALRIEPFNMRQLMVGAWIVCLGRRAISRVWETTGHSRLRNHAAAFRPYSEAAWNWDEVCRIQLLAIVARLVPGMRILESEGIEVVQTAVRAPNQNAYAERFVQTIKQECLGLFIVLGEKHLRHIIQEFVAHYHTERPHLGVGSLPPLRQELPEPVESIGPQDVVARERLGGLLRHYERKVA